MAIAAIMATANVRRVNMSFSYKLGLVMRPDNGKDSLKRR